MNNNIQKNTTNIKPVNVDNLNSPETDFKEGFSNNFEFPLGVKDTLFVLTRNNSDYKDGINNMISKMVAIKELKYINLDDLSKILDAFGIDKLNIFSINNDCVANTINTIKSDKGSKVVYVDLNSDKFMQFINADNKFLEYNKNSLFILRNGNFLDIKNLFSHISGYQINIGRWRGSKSPHIKSSRY
jgi:hypothetical protein